MLALEAKHVIDLTKVLRFAKPYYGLLRPTKPKIPNQCVSSALDPKPLKITFGGRGGDTERGLTGL